VIENVSIKSAKNNWNAVFYF